MRGPSARQKSRHMVISEMKAAGIPEGRYAVDSGSRERFCGQVGIARAGTPDRARASLSDRQPGRPGRGSVAAAGSPGQRLAAAAQLVGILRTPSRFAASGVAIDLVPPRLCELAGALRADDTEMDD